MDAQAAPHERTARHRTTQRARGLRQVGLWLPDVTNPAYQARLVESYRRLADLTPDETPNAALCRISGQVGTAGGTIGRSNAYGAGVQALSALTGYWLPSQTPNQLN